MGSAQSLAMPAVADFGQSAGGLDRSRVHDVPWLATLREIGEVEESGLEELLASCSNAELHCARAFFRAYRAFMAEREEHEEDTVLFCQRLYFVVAQSPSVLVIFYSMLHQAALLGIDADALQPLPDDAPLIGVALSCYAQEKAFPECAVAAGFDRTGTVNAIRNVLTVYVDEMRDLLQNPAFGEPEVEAVQVGDTACSVYTLRPPDWSLEARVCTLGGALLSLRALREDSEEWAEPVVAEELVPDRGPPMRAAVTPENSSSCIQVFYSDATRLEYAAEAGGALLVRLTSENGSGVFQCRLARPAAEALVARTESKTLERVGALPECGLAELWLANGRLAVKDASLTVEGEKFLVKLKL